MLAPNMTLKDLLKKKEKISSSPPDPIAPPSDPRPDFTILRSDSNTQEILSPPSFPAETTAGKGESHHSHFTKHFARLRTSSNASNISNKSRPSSRDNDSRPSSRDEKSTKRLSGRFHLAHSRDSSRSSINVRNDLPDISPVLDLKGEEAQAAWEERATILAKENLNVNLPLSHDGGVSPRSSRPMTPTRKQKLEEQPGFHPEHLGDPVPRGRTLSDAKSDDDIQAAIRLHEEGDLEPSTAMFGRLAERGNVMAEIMYGLALRHGWGTSANPTLAITYLSSAASSSASVESEALRKGVKKGGAAKGELVLAIYELANSFRHGWGVTKDPVAARKYYEVAANLGDTDAMNEVAKCWEDGYGGKKDRVSTVTLPSPLRKFHQEPLAHNIDHQQPPLGLQARSPSPICLFDICLPALPISSFTTTALFQPNASHLPHHILSLKPYPSHLGINTETNTH